MSIVEGPPFLPRCLRWTGRGQSRAVRPLFRQAVERTCRQAVRLIVSPLCLCSFGWVAKHVGASVRAFALLRGPPLLRARGAPPASFRFEAAAPKGCCFPAASSHRRRSGAVYTSGWCQASGQRAAQRDPRQG
eukprot:8908489-Lingulodinium_polyedra.AAC.1